MNKLLHLREFEDILDDYKISENSIRTLKQTNLVLLVAPTSAGRNTIIRELLKTGDYSYIISDTTRKPRVNDEILERSGVEYWFRDEKEMLEDLREGKYLEAAIIHRQQVSGISIRELDKANQLQKIAITDIEIVGVHTIIDVKPDTNVIFVLPPGFEEWQRRILHRGHMTDEELRRRLESASQELLDALEHDYYTFIVNDTVEHAVQQIHHLARLGSIDDEEQAHARNLAEQLYIETHAYLQSL